MRLPSNRSILIVEDNRYYASMIENHLHQYPGFTVAAFDNGDAAMEAYDRVRPDIVLLDYHLNVEDDSAPTGYDYLQQIKDRNPEQAVVMLSSNDNVKQVVELLKTGAYDYVLKDESAFEQLDKVLLNLEEVLSIRTEVKNLKSVLRRQNRRFAWTLAAVAVIVTACFEWLA